MPRGRDLPGAFTLGKVSKIAPPEVGVEEVDVLARGSNDVPEGLSPVRCLLVEPLE